MLSALSVLESIEARLIGTGGTPARPSVIELDDFFGHDLSGRLRLGLEYPLGHRLHAAVTIDASYGYPLWSSYSFHLLDARGRTVFRYDNPPHHPELSTFPEHKHLGELETPHAHLRPSLSALVEEVQQAASPEEHR